MNMAGNGQFQKGDPRINRKGRPKGFDSLRKLFLEIAHEVPLDKNGDPLVINGHQVTVVEALARQWATSKNPAVQKMFMEYAFGKVSDKTEVTGENSGPIKIEVKLPSADE